MEYSYARVFISGHVIEVYQYGKGVQRQTNRCGRAGKGKLSEQERVQNRLVALVRARRELRRIINSNFNRWGELSKFVTLTFRNNVFDLQLANKHFRSFIKRLNYAVFKTKDSVAKYTAVVEFQKRGAVHYHVVFYNLPYIAKEDLERIWGHGFVDIHVIDNVDNVGAYVSKYLTKSNFDERLRGHKCYFNSRGLKKPIVRLLKPLELEELLKSLPENALVYERLYSNEYVGTMLYKQFNLKREVIKQSV